MQNQKKSKLNKRNSIREMAHTVMAVHAWATGSKGQKPEPNSRGIRRVRHSKRRDVFFQKAPRLRATRRLLPSPPPPRAPPPSLSLSLSLSRARARRRRTRRELFLSFVHLLYPLLPDSRTTFAVLTMCSVR